MSVSQTYSLLSDRINALSESQTLAMSRKARELGAQGVQVINLSIGEPDFQTPAHIKEAAKQAIDEGFSWYTPVPGYADLRGVIADKLRRENHLDWKAENIVVSTGAKQSLANVILSLVNPGDEVIIFSPYWVSYSEIVKLAEGVTVLLEGSFENGFKATAQQLENAITPRTKLVMYSSPCNPTGAVFSKEELTAIAGVVARHENIFVLADEIYEYIRFHDDYFSIGSLDYLRDRVITVNGFSKGFAMTGWRVGYIAAAKWIADACDKIQGQVTSGTCSISQRAAVVAYTDMAPTRAMAEAYRRRRDLVVALVSDIPGVKTYVPDGAFYLFPDIRYYLGKTDGKTTLHTAEDLCLWLLSEAHVSLVTGEAFGAPECIRISFAASEENLKEAIRRVKETLTKLH
ncbi:MAG: pyridoxal phosphate-dependent aminotransferase [Ferruginibacter sp.]|nr:pyridoxal phosphate-dependent aminotransferase [Cytophagales bacterium]